MRLLVATGALLLLTACPEDPRTAGTTDGTAGQTTAGQTTAGVGDPGAGPPGEGERPKNARFEIAEGQGVKLKGTISYDGSKTGAMRVDFLTVADQQHPQLVNATTLDGIGAYELDLPKGFGELHMVAFIDVLGDGPTPTDPAAAVSFTVADADLTDIDLVLSDEPDLGVLTPGGSPNMNAGPAEDNIPRPPGSDPNAPVPEGEAAPAPDGAPGGPPEGSAPPAQGSAAEGE